MSIRNIYIKKIPTLVIYTCLCLTSYSIQTQIKILLGNREHWRSFSSVSMTTAENLSSILIMFFKKQHSVQVFSSVFLRCFVWNLCLKIFRKKLSNIAYFLMPLKFCQNRCCLSSFFYHQRIPCELSLTILTRISQTLKLHY